MLLLSTIIKVAETHLRDDALKILLDWYIRPEIVLPFTFGELNKIFQAYMEFGLLQPGHKGLIYPGESYIEYLYDWQNETWFLNAGSYFDKLCKQKNIYPKYLHLYE
jgi:hypothetical protein